VPAVTEITDFVFEILPGLIGLVVVSYVFMTMYALKARFFEVMRSWFVLLFAVSLMALWILEIAIDTLAGQLVDVHAPIDLTFVIVSVWFSLSAVLLTTIYSKHNSVEQFKAWLRQHPLNLLTGWGMLGAALVVLVWTMNLKNAESLDQNSWVLAAVTAYFVATVALDILLPLSESRKGTMARLDETGRRSMILLAVTWTGIPATELVLDVILKIGKGFEEYNPHSWIMVALFLVAARAVRGAGFLAITVDAEAETYKRDGFRSFDIPRGVYLIYDDKSDSAFSLFSDLVSLPLRPDAKIPSNEDSASATLEFLIPRGLVVTREFPDNVRKERNLQVTPIIWLTESPGERRVAPTSLAVLTDTLIRFMETNPNSIVLMEGIEYMMTFNEFRKVLRALDSLNEVAWITKARLLVAVHPKAFGDRDLAMLERDRTVVRGTSGIEELKRESMVMGASI
jgi:hypothetical protein